MNDFAKRIAIPAGTFALGLVFGFLLGGQWRVENPAPSPLPGVSSESIQAVSQYLGQQGPTNPSGMPPPNIMQKVQRLQQAVPRYVQGGGDPSQVAPLMQKLDASMRMRDFSSADRTLDQLLAVVDRK